MTLKLNGIIGTTLLFILHLTSSIALACPLRSGLPDVNCDEKTIIAFFGDSVTRGVGDPLMTSKSGAVQLRLRRYFKNTLGLPLANYQSLNFGSPGISCKNLKIKLRNAVLDNEKGVAAADSIIIACGLNDFWEYNDSDRSLSYIQGMRRFVKQRGIHADVAKLTTTNRSFQQPFVDELNEKIDNYSKRIRFDLLDPLTMLQGDNLHPNNDGYNFMFDIFADYLFGPTYLAHAKQFQKLVDMDSDGVYDKFEIAKFGTDPSLADTDGDGVSDSDEIFVFHTNPLEAPPI